MPPESQTGVAANMDVREGERPGIKVGVSEANASQILACMSMQMMEEDSTAHFRRTTMRGNPSRTSCRSMTPKIAGHESSGEAAILARILGDADGALSPAIARYLLDRGFGESDKARMHDLAVRNQADALTADEKAELFAYAKAGTVLAILKSRARRVIRAETKKQRVSS